MERAGSLTTAAERGTWSPARLRALLVVMCTALAIVLGAGTSLAVALPAIAESTGASQTQLSYVVNIYAVVFAALLLPAGAVADRFGRRPVLLIGLVVFAGASSASAFTADPAVLIGLRMVAGAGAAAVMPVTLSVLTDAYPPGRRSFAVSVWAGVSSAGSLIGLLLAGVLLDQVWWGSVQVVYGVAAFALAATVPALVPPGRNPALTLDVPGALLAAGGLGALVLGVIEGAERGLDGLTVTATTVGFAMLVLFVVHERRTRTPMLDVRLFRSRGLSAGSTLIFLQFFAASGFFVLAPQFLQSVTGRSTLQAVLALIPLSVGVAPASALAPRLMARFGGRATAIAGMVVMAAGLGLLALIAAGPFWQFAICLTTFGAGFGLAVTPGTTLIVDGLPEDRRTLASALNDVTREIGAALGGTVLVSVLVASYRGDLATVTAGLPAPAADAARDGVVGALTVAERLGSAGAALADTARDAFTAGYRLALAVAAGVLLLGALVTAVLAPTRRAAARPPAPTHPNPEGRIR
jgi:EmrB/QacA subfamily drug resistance transporter